MSQDPPDEVFEAMVSSRSTNLRQLLQAATRRLNVQIAETLRNHGYRDITATHTMLLSNMTLENDTVTSIAQRASVSSQAVGRLVSELVDRGYLRTSGDDRDARRRLIVLTVKGRRLMTASFATLGEFEHRLKTNLGQEAVDSLRRCLQTIAAA